VQNNTVTMRTETELYRTIVTMGTETELYRTTQLPWGPRPNCTEQHSYHGDRDRIVQNNTVTMGTETELYRTIVTMGTETELYRTTQLPWGPRLNCTEQHSYHGDQD